MRIIKGDLLELAVAGNFDVIVHGCNCFCAMGAGIAHAVKQQFPEAYQADCDTQVGNKAKLGNYSSAQVKRGDVLFTIINAYTQFDTAGTGVKADYQAIRAVFARIKNDFSGKHIAYPKIGAGLAGGDWQIIAKIIEQELSGEQHTLVEFKPS